MSERNLGLVVTVVMLVLCAAQILYYAPLLPDIVASHFSFDGTPDGWGDKDSFLILYTGFVVFLASLFVAIALFLPRIPPALINMPDKDYWLAPERKEATLSYLSGRLLAMGNVTVLFIIVLFQFTIQANLRAEEDIRLGAETLVLAGVYSAYMLIWVIRLFASLRRPR
jgi:hypothetical protein